MLRNRFWFSTGACFRHKRSVPGGRWYAIGVGAIGMAIYRAMRAIPPAADLTGGIDVVALPVNIAAALALMRFRDQGHANAGGQDCVAPEPPA